MAWLLLLVALQSINCPWETSVLYYTENFTDVDEPRRSRTCQVSRDPEFRLKCYE
jgi:hypothetical protein